MRIRQRMTRMRLVTCLLGVCAAIALFVLGRISTDPGDTRADSYRTGLNTGYIHGLDAGRAEGVQEGRAAQESQALPPAARDSAREAFNNGYRAGTNDAFNGYDGGWSFATPYVITLARGGPGITYRFASRTPLQAGIDYYRCPHSPGLCQEPRS